VTALGGAGALAAVGMAAVAGAVGPAAGSMQTLDGASQSARNTISEFAGVSDSAGGALGNLSGTLDTTSQAMSRLGATTAAAMSAVASSVQSSMSRARSSVSSAVSSIASTLSRIERTYTARVEVSCGPLPHFSMSGDFNAQTGSVPVVGVSWYATGGVFGRPTVVGVGDAGPGNPELVAPRKMLSEVVREESGAGLEEVVRLLRALLYGQNRGAVYIDGDRLVGEIADRVSRGSRAYA
ncbi:hypothetical protein ACTM8Z_01440, partial [Atopobiaceae bacterium HCP3S3_D6]